jgi:hypothetical protein
MRIKTTLALIKLAADKKTDQTLCCLYNFPKFFGGLPQDPFVEGKEVVSGARMTRDPQER